LFRKAKRKNIIVQKALQDNKWIGHISPVVSAVELHEYVLIWELVHRIQLVEGMEDSIVWRWTADGEYTAQKRIPNPIPGDFQQVESVTGLESKGRSQMQVFCMDPAT
jgi:hypothetical protein